MEGAPSFAVTMKKESDPIDEVADAIEMTKFDAKAMKRLSQIDMIELSSKVMGKPLDSCTVRIILSTTSNMRVM
jgi:hypothetical protein